jgi:hypothetical protein
MKVKAKAAGAHSLELEVDQAPAPAPAPPVASPTAPAPSEKGEFFRPGRLLRKADEAESKLHYVLNVVLEPCTVETTKDTQGDFYSEDDIWQARRTFMQKQGVGLFHDNPDVKGFALLDNWIAPFAFDPASLGLAGDPVAKGAWLMGIEIDEGVNPTAWAGIVKGDFTAFSIEGTGQRTKVGKAAVDAAVAKSAPAEDDEEPTRYHLHDLNVSAVRVVPKGANARNGFMIMKADDGAAAPAPAPEPVAPPAPPVVKTTTVEKVALRDGESVGQFLEALRGAFNAKTNPSNDDANRMWCTLVFEAFLVAEKYADDTCWRYDWTRAADGAFDFGQPVQVNRKVTFEPVVAKAPEPVAPEPAAPVEPPAPAAKGARSAKEKIAALAVAIRASLHDLVDEALAAPVPEPEPAPAVKAAPKPAEPGRPNSLSGSYEPPQASGWDAICDRNLNDLRRSTETGA